MTITAKIEPDESGKGLWIVIDGDEGTAWPITEEEIKPIEKACREYLKINQKE